MHSRVLSESTGPSGWICEGHSKVYMYVVRFSAVKEGGSPLVCRYEVISLRFDVDGMGPRGPGLQKIRGVCRHSCVSDHQYSDAGEVKYDADLL